MSVCVFSFIIMNNLNEKNKICCHDEPENNRTDHFHG
jgi:hypothetical protein